MKRSHAFHSRPVLLTAWNRCAPLAFHLPALPASLSSALPPYPCSLFPSTSLPHPSLPLQYLFLTRLSPSYYSSGFSVPLFVFYASAFLPPPCFSSSIFSSRPPLFFLLLFWSLFLFSSLPPLSFPSLYTPCLSFTLFLPTTSLFSFLLLHFGFPLQ